MKRPPLVLPAGLIVQPFPSLVHVGKEGSILITLSAEGVDQDVEVDILSSDHEVVYSNTTRIQRLNEHDTITIALGVLNKAGCYTIRAKVKGSTCFSIGTMFVLDTDAEETMELFNQALTARMRARALMEQRLPEDAVAPLREAAEIYASVEEYACSALTWRDLAFVFMNLGRYNEAYDAAVSALTRGSWDSDPGLGPYLVALVTKLAVMTSRPSYESDLHSLFYLIGPERAYAAGILDSMSPRERRLFATTILKIFPCRTEQGWILIFKDAASRRRGKSDSAVARIEDDDNVVASLFLYCDTQSSEIQLEPELTGV